MTYDDDDDDDDDDDNVIGKKIWRGVLQCTYFPNAFFAILYISLVFMFIYCKDYRTANTLHSQNYFLLYFLK
jgi:inner membrane protein involved in colicin E2 resistance